MASTGELIRRWREEQTPRVSQMRLAELLRIKQGTISDWERDKKPPNDRNLRKLVKLRILPRNVLRALEV